MSRSTTKKENSYSQFRKKNSLSQSSLNRSVLEIDHSISLIADQKTQQLLSLENQLQSMVRNRSASTKPNAKNVAIDHLALNLLKKSAQETGALHNIQKKSIDTNKQTDNPPKTNRSTNFHTLNQTFEIIQQSEIFNQQDNALYDTKQSKSKVPSKTQNKTETNLIPKRKGIQQVTAAIKIDTKATIKDLDEMQKRLQSAKKAKKLVGRDTNPKKTEVIARQPPLKAERRIQKTLSEANLLTETAKNKALQVVKEKQAPPKPLAKRKPTVDLAKPSFQTQRVLVPTKMVNLQEKQKLLKQFDKIRQSIRNTEICADDLGAIRLMLKGIGELIN